MDFIKIPVDEATLQLAKAIRQERDRQYKNIYSEVPTDMRWLGEVGEICFDRWIRTQTGLPVAWIKDQAAGKPDFIVGSTRVDIKTVKRKDPMRPNYTAQVTAKHVMEPVDYFFFASYITNAGELWLLGGKERDLFRQEAAYYGPGDWVHANYQVRTGHEIYNIEVSRLIEPTKWVHVLR